MEGASALNRAVFLWPAVAAAGLALVAVYVGAGWSSSSAAEVCTSYASTDAPKDIAPMNSTVVSVVNVPDSFTLSEVTVGPIEIAHTWVSDLDVYLLSPNNTRIELFTNVGTGGDDFAGTVLDDAANESISNAMAPFTGTFRPEGSLATFVGESSAGVWQMELRDTAHSADSGTLEAWALELCRTAEMTPTPTVTVSAPPTPKPTPEATPVLTPTPTPTTGPTSIPTAAPTVTPSAEATPSSTPSPVPTTSAGPTPSVTPRPSPTPEADSDGDGLADATEVACGSDPLVEGSRPERIDTSGDDDGDTLVNEALPAGADVRDCDGDGYVGTTEDNVETSDQDPCGWTGWPSDLVPGSFQPNTLNVQDVGSFLTPVRRFGTSAGHPDFHARWDLVPGGTIGGTINLEDVAATVVGPTGFPPMFGGLRAFGKTCPWAP